MRTWTGYAVFSKERVSILLGAVLAWQRGQLFVVIHPAFPLLTTALPTLQGALKILQDSFPHCSYLFNCLCRNFQYFLSLNAFNVPPGTRAEGWNNWCNRDVHQAHGKRGQCNKYNKDVRHTLPSTLGRNAHTHTHTHTHSSLYIYVCMCICCHQDHLSARASQYLFQVQEFISCVVFGAILKVKLLLLRLSVLFVFPLIFLLFGWWWCFFFNCLVWFCQFLPLFCSVNFFFG